MLYFVSQWRAKAAARKLLERPLQPEGSGLDMRYSITGAAGGRTSLSGPGTARPSVNGAEAARPSVGGMGAARPSVGGTETTRSAITSMAPS